MGLTRAQFRDLSVVLHDELADLGGEIRVQGSRAGYTAGAGSDIDIMIRVPPERFDELLAGSSLARANPGSAAERTLLHAREVGKIHPRPLGLAAVRDRIAEQLGIDVDLSVIRAGGTFDAPPQKGLPDG
jgi:hypothetical protein